jgi:PilZ domain
MNQEKRGLRFPFRADAEVILGGSTNRIPARVMELSLRGCFVETSIPLMEQQQVQLKIFHSNKYFEAPAQVIYLKSNGAGFVFGDVKLHFRDVLQEWVLAALDSQAI